MVSEKTKGKGECECRGAYISSFFSRDSRLYKRVCLSVHRSVRPSVGPSIRWLVGLSIRNAFFLIGQKWVETNKNEISDEEAGRDYTSHDLFRVYELVLL